MKTVVFHIITKLDIGGAERVAINIASQTSSEYEHHIVEVIRGTSVFTSQLIAELQHNKIPYHRAVLPILIHFHYVFEKFCAFLFPLRFFFLWLKYRPAIIHCHTEMPDMAIWLACRLFPFIDVKIVRTIHNTVLWTGMNIIGPRVEAFMQKRKANVAISKNVQEAYYKKYGELPPVIYNGVSPVQQLPYNNIIADKINICFAGRLENQKGIDVLCKIIKELKDDSRYYFHIFGSGRQQSLVDEIRELKNVSVNPPVNGISAYMSSFDYLIMPSRHEGFGLVSVEASLAGSLIMINNCPGLSETIPENWPLKVTDNNIEEWLHLFRNVLPTLNAEGLKSQILTYVNKHFSIHEMQNEYNNLYKTPNR